MPSKTEIIGLGIAWDEVSGPEIVSYNPPDSLNDPQGIAMQIYMSAAAVFGQGKIEEVQFTLPLLSWSPDGIVRVMFGNWIDTEVRGGERPCYVAFIMTKEIENLLYKDLTRILKASIAKIKKEKQKFDINPYLHTLKEKLESLRDSQDHNIKSFREKTSISEYSIAAAQRDLSDAASMWDSGNDNALKLALKAGKRLEGLDKESAGNAYFLSGTIFFHKTNYNEAISYFEMASQEYNSVNKVKEAAEASFNAAICYYRIGNYKKAKEGLFVSAPILRDQGDEYKKARLYLYLGLSLDELKDYEDARHYFQLAIDSARKSDDYEFAGQICNIFASKLRNIDKPELAAKYRENAAKNFFQQEMFHEAGTTYSIAAIDFENRNNLERSKKCLKEAIKAFLLDEDYLAAGKASLKISKLISHHPPKYLHQSIDIFSKLVDKNIREYWTGVTYQELGKHYEKRKEFLTTLENYEKAKRLLKGTENVEFVSVILKIANISFQLENYSNAAESFDHAQKIMLEHSIGGSKQQGNCKNNAIKSFKKSALDNLAVLNHYLFKKQYIKSLKSLESVLNDFDAVLRIYNGLLPKQEQNWFERMLMKIIIKETLFETETDQKRFKTIISNSKINKLIHGH